MPDIFDQLAAPQRDVFDTLAKPALPKKKTESSMLRRAADLPIGIVKGVAKLPNVAVGLADIPTGGRVGKFIEDKTGYDFKAADEFYDPLLSPETQEAQRKVSAAKGFVPTLKTAIENPSSIGQAISESIPSMVAGGMVGRGIGALAKAPRFVAGALGEGVVSAGQTAEDVRINQESRTLTPKQSVTSLATGLGVGALSLASGGLSKKFGLSDIDTVLAGGGLEAAEGAAKKGIVKRVAGGMLTEGALEEMPQSLWEQGTSNFANDKPVTEGMGNAAAMGAITGAVMGGGLNLLSGAPVKAEDEPPGIPEIPAVSDFDKARIEIEDRQAAEQAQAEVQQRQQQQTSDAQALPAIEAKIVNPQTMIEPEDRAVVERAFNDPLDDKIRTKAAAILAKLDKADEKEMDGARKEERQAVKEQLAHTVLNAQQAPFVSENLDALSDLTRHADPEIRKEALAAQTKILDLQAKEEEKLRKATEQEAAKNQKEIDDGAKSILDEQAKDIDHKAKIDLQKNKIATLQKSVTAEMTPERKKAIGIRVKAEEAKLDILTQKAQESAQETTDAQALAKGYTLSFMGTQEGYEAVKAHISKVIEKGKAAWQNFKEFAADMRSYFGKHVQPHLLKLWKHASDFTKQKLGEQRGSFSTKPIVTPAPEAKVQPQGNVEIVAPVVDMEVELETDEQKIDRNLKETYARAEELKANPKEKKKEEFKPKLRNDPEEKAALKEMDTTPFNLLTEDEDAAEAFRRKNSEEARAINTRDKDTEAEESPFIDLEENKADTFDPRNKTTDKHEGLGTRRENEMADSTSDLRPVNKILEQRIDKAMKGFTYMPLDTRQAIIDQEMSQYQEKQDEVIDKIMTEIGENKNLDKFFTDQTVEEYVKDGVPTGNVSPRLQAWGAKIGDNINLVRFSLEAIAQSYDMQDVKRYLLNAYKSETGIDVKDFKKMTVLPAELFELAEMTPEKAETQHADLNSLIYALSEAGWSEAEITNMLTEKYQIDPHAFDNNQALKVLASKDLSLLSAAVERIVETESNAAEKAEPSRPAKEASLLALDLNFLEPGINAPFVEELGSLISNLRKQKDIENARAQRGRLIADRQEKQFQEVDEVAQVSTEAAPILPVFFNILNKIMADGDSIVAHDATFSTLKAKITKELKDNPESHGQDVRNLWEKILQADKAYNLKKTGDGLPSNKLFATIFRLTKYHDEGQFREEVSEYDWVERELGTAEATEMLRDLTQLGMDAFEDIELGPQFVTDTLSLVGFKNFNPMDKFDDGDPYGRKETQEHGKQPIVMVQELDDKGKPHMVKYALTDFRQMEKVNALNKKKIAIIEEAQNATEEVKVEKRAELKAINAQIKALKATVHAGKKHAGGFNFERVFSLAMNDKNGKPILNAFKKPKLELTAREIQSRLDAGATIVDSKEYPKRLVMNEVRLLINSFHQDTDLARAHDIAMERVEGYKDLPHVEKVRELRQEKTRLEELRRAAIPHNAIFDALAKPVNDPELAKKNKVQLSAMQFSIMQGDGEFSDGSKYDLDAISKAINKNKRLLNDAHSLARAPLIQKLMAQSSVMTKEKFTDLAKGYTEQMHGHGSISPAKLYDIYKKAGGDTALMHTAATKIIDEKIAETVSKAYDNALRSVGLNSTSKGITAESYGALRKTLRSALTAHLSKQDRVLYEKFAGTGISLVSKQRLEAYDAFVNGLDPNKLMLFRQMLDAERRAAVMQYDAKLKPSEDPIMAESSSKAKDSKKPLLAENTKEDLDDRIEKGEKITVDYIALNYALDSMGLDVNAPFEGQLLASVGITKKDTDHLDATELGLMQQYAGEGLTPMKTSSKIVQYFIRKLGQAFGADIMMVTADPGFGGRYIPGETGRATIVLNMNRKDMSKVFAHEMFHHMLNRLSTDQYKDFQAAIKASVVGPQWRKAMARLAKKMYPNYTEDQLSEILSGSIADNSRAQVVRGDLYQDMQDPLIGSKDSLEDTDSFADRLIPRTSLDKTVYSWLDAKGMRNSTTNIKDVPLRARKTMTVTEAYQAEPANYYEKKSEGNFTTNPLNTQSKFQQKSPSVGQVNINQNRNGSPNTSTDKAMEVVRTKYPGLTQEMIDAMHNELYADIFAEAILTEGFWKQLGNTLEGKGIAAQLMVKIAKNGVAFLNAIHGATNASLRSPLISDMVKGWTTLTPAYPGRGEVTSAPKMTMSELLAQAIMQAHESTELRDKIERASVTMDDVKNEAKYFGGLARKGFTAGKGVFSGMFPKEIKSYKDVMTALEEFGSKVLDWLSTHKPAGVFADFGKDKRIVGIATKLLHAGNKEREEANLRIVKNFKDAFKGMSPKDLEDLHDKVVRSNNVDAIMSLPEHQKNAFLAMRAEAKKIHAELVKNGILTEGQYRENHMGQSIRWMKNGVPISEEADALLHDDIDQLKTQDRFTKSKSNWTTEAIKASGLQYQTIDPLELFLNYVEDSTKLIRLKELIATGYVTEIDGKRLIQNFANEVEAAKKGYVKIGADAFQAIHTVMGQTFKVQLPDGTFLTEEGSEIVFKSEDDALAFLEGRAKDGFLEGQIVPSAVTHEYKTLEGYKVDRYIRVQTEVKEAAFDIDYGPMKKEKSKPKFMKDENGTITFRTKAEADKYLEDHPGNADEKFYVNPVMRTMTPTYTSDMYMNPELAELVNVILSRDRLRNGKLFGVSGNQVMNVKNTMTMLELTLSTFHFFTISQELAASYAGWMTKRYSGKLGDPKKKGLVKAFNVLTAYKESRELKELFEKIIEDNAYAETPEAKEALLRLLGTDSADAVDIYAQHFDHGGAIAHQDRDLQSGINSWGKMRYETDARNDAMSKLERIKDTKDGIVESFMDTWEKQRQANPDSKLLPLSKAMLHHTLVGSTAWLMEEGIPKIKFAAFAREYSLKVDQARAKGIELTAQEKSDLARDTMKFVEDRFGEVNWKNMWLNKSYKTALQFLFRSFTWMAGSWKALGKAGIDWVKWGWFKAKGEQYEMTEKGYWGLAVLTAHSLTVGAVSLAYFGVAAVGGGEQEDDEELPLLTWMLFPRIDPYDNTKRLSIPSYVTEGYKILSHLGILGSNAEPTKLVSGRFNSLVGGMADLARNEDFKGVLIRNPDDSALYQAYAMIRHMAPLPMSFANVHKTYQAQGMDPSMLASLAGFSDAPASAKRSEAANLAFDLSRRENMGKETTEDEMDLRDDLKRAMRKYVEGDRSDVDRLLKEGKVSPRQYEIALTRYPIINNRENSKYKDQLSQALQRLTVKSALKVYEEMTEAEKAKHTKEITKKVNNMLLRKDKPKATQMELKAKWRELKTG
jgi:hypothetical protein